MSFEVNQVSPDVVHIRDAMGVCMTLLIGDRAALLVDTGYGTEDVAAFVRTLTDRPLTVLLTHCHHDHALGARWFGKTVMMPEDQPLWPAFTGAEKRQHVLSQAMAKGLPVTEGNFLSGTCALPYAIHGGALELGGLTAQIIPCPGHTPGSCAVYIPQRKLLLTGDNWNPCTWLFFEEALPVRIYREHLRGLQALDFTQVLCPHQLTCYPREVLDAFINGLTDDTLNAAIPVHIGGYERFDTRQAHVANGQILVFDGAKY